MSNRMECRRYSRDGRHLGTAALLTDFVVMWTPIQTAEEIAAAKPYPQYRVDPARPWDDFERKAGLSDIAGLECSEIPCEEA